MKRKSTSGVVLLWTAILSFPCWSQVSEGQLESASGEDGQWLTHGLSYAETRHSPLTQINPDNVAELGLAWSFESWVSRGMSWFPLLLQGSGESAFGFRFVEGNHGHDSSAVQPVIGGIEP